MKKVTQSYLLLGIVLPMLLVGMMCTPERSFAEVSEVRIAKQYGLTLSLIHISEPTRPY